MGVAMEPVSRGGVAAVRMGAEFPADWRMGQPAIENGATRASFFGDGGAARWRMVAPNWVARGQLQACFPVVVLFFPYLDHY